MDIIKVNCSSCQKELKILISKGENHPDKVVCKSCSQGNPKKEPRHVRRQNWFVTHKMDLTRCEKAARKRIYGTSS